MAILDLGLRAERADDLAPVTGSPCTPSRPTAAWTRRRSPSPPKGYTNGVLAAPGRTLYLAGQVGWDPD